MDIENENIIMLLDAHNDNSSKSTLFNNFYNVLKNGIMKQDKRRITNDHTGNYQQTQLQEEHKKELQKKEKELKEKTDKIQYLTDKVDKLKEQLQEQKDLTQSLSRPLSHSQSSVHADSSPSNSSLAQQFTAETNTVSDIRCVNDIVTKLTPRLVNINHRFQTSLKVDDIPSNTPLTAFNIHQYKLINYYLEVIR